MRTKAECHDCGVVEGKLHKLGCDMEVCSKCLEKFAFCDCSKRRTRIPYVIIPYLCKLCGKQYPPMFRVSNATWKKFVPPNLQKEALCQKCYDMLLKLFPRGWKLNLKKSAE